MIQRALVIVPTYNERTNIEELVRRLFAAVSPDSVHLLVVDDASPDETAQAVAALAARHDGITLMRRDQKLGLGSAYVEALSWGLDHGFGALVEMDADLSHDPADVPRLLEALAGADLVIGSRYVLGGRVENWSGTRRALSRAANVYARTWLRLGVRDATSGFRAYRRSALEDLHLETVRSEGYAFQIEMVHRVQGTGGRIVEVPITFSERASGRSKMTPRIVAEAMAKVLLWAIRDSTRARRAGSSSPRDR